MRFKRVTTSEPKRLMPMWESAMIVPILALDVMLVQAQGFVLSIRTTFIKALDFYLLRSKNGHSTHRQRADLLVQGGGQDAFALDEIAINGRLDR